MFRAAVLSTVLTLAAGPNMALSCPIWCHGEMATTSACQQHDATTFPRVTGGDSCRMAATDAPAVVREESKRDVLTNHGHQASIGAGFDLAAPLTRSCSIRSAGTLKDGSPPVLIALRI